MLRSLKLWEEALMLQICQDDETSEKVGGFEKRIENMGCEALERRNKDLCSINACKCHMYSTKISGTTLGPMPSPSTLP